LFLLLPFIPYRRGGVPFFPGLRYGVMACVMLDKMLFREGGNLL